MREAASILSVKRGERCFAKWRRGSITESAPLSDATLRQRLRDPSPLRVGQVMAINQLSGGTLPREIRKCSSRPDNNKRSVQSPNGENYTYRILLACGRNGGFIKQVKRLMTNKFKFVCRSLTYTGCLYCWHLHLSRVSLFSTCFVSACSFFVRSWILYIS